MGSKSEQRIKQGTVFRTTQFIPPVAEQQAAWRVGSFPVDMLRAKNDQNPMSNDQEISALGIGH